MDGLMLRANYAEGFRAPGITELFAPQNETNLAYNEPCLNYGTSSASATVKANCAAEGLPANFTLSSDQSSTIVGGNPDLEPEESESMTAGFVFTADNGFTLAVDYYSIEITNGIGTAGTNNVVNGCYNSPNFSSGLCDLIVGTDHPLLASNAPHPTSPRRDALGTISGVILANANLSTFETKGIDFDMSYSMDVAGGSLSLGLDGTWLDSYTYLPMEGEEIVEAAGMVAADQWETNLAVFPELRMNLNATYATSDYAVTWSGRYQSEGEDLFASEDNLDNIADSVFYHDIQGSYFWENYTFTVGVRNATDVEAPYITNYDDMNTIQASYDVAGAYYYARVTAKF
jgi:iron complex outermembrane receptor protein